MRHSCLVLIAAALVAGCDPKQPVLPDAAVGDAAVPGVADASVTDSGVVSSPEDGGVEPKPDGGVEPKSDGGVEPKPDGGPRTPLGNVDITVVYPLPPPQQVSALLSPEDLGRGGTLLPHAVLAGGMLPELDERFPLPNDAARWAALRVVAVRFDPCAGVVLPQPPGATCAAQLRLVLQSLRSDSGSTLARDGALHAFYALTPQESAEVLATLRGWRAAESLPVPTQLGVHPRLQAEGVSGPHALRLKALILKYAGPASLIRVTQFLRVDPSDYFQRWTFRMREKKAGTWVSSEIPGSSVVEQELLTVAGGRWDAEVTPPITNADNVTRLFKADIPQERAAFEATVRVVNPRVHSSESIDCSSCHLTPSIIGFARANRQLLVSDSPSRFQSALSTQAVSMSDVQATLFDNIHMLSWLDAGLNVSQRVANDTAALLELINSGALD